jgi:hypothetical protein
MGLLSSLLKTYITLLPPGLVTFFAKAPVNESPVSGCWTIGPEQSAQKRIHQACSSAACRAYRGALASLTHHCASGTTSGSSDSGAARGANRRVFRKVLSPLASGFRLLDALINVSLGHARSNPHQVFIRIK